MDLSEIEKRYEGLSYEEIPSEQVAQSTLRDCLWLILRVKELENIIAAYETTPYRGV